MKTFLSTTPSSKPSTMSMSSIMYLLALLLPKIVESAISIDFDISSQQIGQAKAKRDALNTALTLQRNVYLTNLSIGSNKDKVVVSIDTGSSELWVMSSDVSCATVDQLHAEDAPTIPNIFNDLTEEYACTENGTFNVKESTSYHFLSDDFSIAFADGSVATGQYGRDNVGVGNVTIQGLKMGVANASSIDVGILGIKRNDEYDNFITLLKKQGYITSAQYAIYMNDKKGNTLFGAVDGSKYQGDLTTTRMEHSAIQINKVSLSLSNNDTSIQSDNQDVIFDTGSTFSTFPTNWIKAIGESINGTYDNNEMAYQVPCKSTLNDINFNFKVSDTTLSIPISDLIINNERTNSKCYLGVMDESLVGSTIFGSDILKHFYVVFNLDEDTLSIAPASKTDEKESSQSSSNESRFSNRSEASSQNTRTMLYTYCMSLIPLSIYVFVLY